MIEYGCECTDKCHVHISSTNNAPVAFLVERNGKQLKVCTKCYLTGDRIIKILVEKSDDASVFFNYDALGAFCLASKISEIDKEVSSAAESIV